MSALSYSCTPDFATLGLLVAVAVVRISDTPRRRGTALESHIREVIAGLEIPQTRALPSLAECHRLYRSAGLTDVLPPAEHLLDIVERSGDLPNINRVVDIYNLVSLATGLSLGAHDLAHIRGDVRFAVTRGGERFTALGSSETEVVPSGEYACMDEDKILCRMDIKQCDETRVTRETRDLMLYVQGNGASDERRVRDGLARACEYLVRYGGAECRVVE